MGVASKISPQTRAATLAKKELQNMLAKTDQTRTKYKKVLDGVKRKCTEVVELFKDGVSTALRVEAQKSGIDKLFEKLSAKKDSISEATFCKKVQGLEGLLNPIQPEQAKLLYDHISHGSGISKRQFLNYVQLYYIVVKSIAFSDVFEVGSCKTVRKAEEDEVIEVLEGPKTDEMGLVRVRAKSMVDSTEGWITVKGNQGTPFLDEVNKIFYCCRKADMPLQAAFQSSSSTIRALEEEEVLELIEGPRKEVLPDAKRGKVKASKD